MGLSEDLDRIAAVAVRYAGDDEQLVGVVAAEPGGGRVYVCAYERSDGGRSWLALDEAGEAVLERAALRDAVSIAALCEAAAETAAGGDLEELRSALVALRLRENPPGIEEAEEAALELERTLGAAPRLASPAYLDRVGAANRRLERALGDQGGSPFAEAMKQAMGAVESLTAEVEGSYKRRLRP